MDVTVPSTYNNKPVTIVARRAFENCKNLTSINFDGTRKQWNAVEKGNSWDLGCGNYVVH